MIGRRVKADTSPDVDLRLARARLAFSRSLELQNRNVLEVSKANLEQLIGQQVFEVKTFKRQNKQLPDLVASEKMAMEFSPAIMKLRAEIRGFAATEKVNNSVLYPQLSIGYEKSSVTCENEEPEQVFLGLDFQPGAGLSARSNVTASRALKEAMQDNLKVLERETRRRRELLGGRF